MSRLSLAALLVPCVAAPALAQGLRDTTPTPLYRPGNPYLPAVSQFGPWAGFPGAVVPTRPWVGPLGGWYGGYYPYYGSFYGSPYVWGWGMTEPYMDRGRPTQAPPLQGAGGTGPVGTQVVVVNPELAAELTLEFPADAAVTLNGQAVEGSGKTRTLTSPQLKAGETYTFDVKASWTDDGKKYEWERVVTLGSGERSKVAVARGFLVKD